MRIALWTPMLRRLTVLLVLALTYVAAPVPPARAEVVPPPLKVTVSNVSEPRYGDALSFVVRSTGLEVNASVRHGSTELAAKPLESGGATFSIPTLGRFFPDRSYKLEILASSETSSGTTTLTFTPSKIPASVQVSRTSVGYRTPFFGVVSAAGAPSSVPPSGRVELVRNGQVVTSYDVRTDGTFALRHSDLTPGSYPGTEVRLVGSPHYADTAPGAGSFMAQLVVTPARTATTATFSSSRVTTGERLTAVASARVTDPDSDAPLSGFFYVHAWPSGNPTASTEVIRANSPNGQQVSFDFTEWARTHPGNWDLQVTFGGGPTLAASNTTTAIAVRSSEAQATVTTLKLDGDQAVVLGAAIPGHVTVTTEHGDKPTGEVLIEVDGRQWARVNATGTPQRLSLSGLAVGTHEVVARYLGGNGQQPSTSATSTVTITRADTVTTVQAPDGERHPGDLIEATVTVTGSSAVPTGPVRLTSHGHTVASGTVSDGVVHLALPALGGGIHELGISYDGDTNTNPSAATVSVTMATPPPPARVASVTKVSKIGKPIKRKLRLLVRVTAAGTVPTGGIVVRRGTKVVARGVLRNGTATLTTSRLPRGRRALLVTYSGDGVALASASRVS